MKDLKPETREQRRWRRTCRRALRAVGWIGGILLAAGVALCLLGGAREEEPHPVPTVTMERAARFAASEEYERVINLGYSEWSALEAANLVFEEMMTP